MSKYQRFNIVRKKLPRNAGPNSKAIWLPVGTIVLFEKDGRYDNGKLELNALDEEYHIFSEDYNKKQPVDNEAPIREQEDSPF